MNKTALIAGASGLVGNILLRRLLDNGYYDKVLAITRSPLAIEHNKLENIIVDFNDLVSSCSLLKADDVFCCLGTTMKKAGSKEAFKKVDYDYVVALATIMKSNGATQFLAITAMGADSNAIIYYNKIKGIAETALINEGFSTLHIIRPSLIIGYRNESRLGESVAQKVMPAFDFLMKGFIKKYAPVPAEKIADKLLNLAQQNINGVHIHLSDTIH